MKFRSVPVVAITLVALSAWARSALADLPPPPVAKAIPVTDTYFGTSVVDPYRWMEVPNNADLAAYLKAQNDRTRAILDSIPGRNALYARIKSLGYSAPIAAIVRRSGVYFIKPYSSWLLVKEPNKKERLLVDLLSVKSRRETITFVEPSDDAKRVAVGATADGNEAQTGLLIIDTATGDTLDALQPVLAVASWRADGKALYYLRYEDAAPGAQASRAFRYARTYEHVIGTPQQSDRLIFGAEANSELAFDADEIASVEVSPQSQWALGKVKRGTGNTLRLYVARKDGLGDAGLPWKPVAGYEDRIVDATLHGDTLYLVSAANGKTRLLMTSAAQPNLATATVVIPPSAQVLAWSADAKDALYVGSRLGGRTRISRVDYTTASVQEISLPVDGTLTGFVYDREEPAFEARLEGWTVPPRWYSYDPSTDKMTPSGLDFHPQLDFSGIVADELQVPARDGTMIPLSIVHRKDMKLDGTNPLLLTAYGSYGLSLRPFFSATTLAWFEQGGVYAVAHVRGGGENGDAWYLAGKDANKHNTIDDFVDCARWLIERRYTSPQRLAASGASAGGIAVGGAITQAPDLFAAAIDEVPLSDELRYEFAINGTMNVSEFGSVRSKAGFANLYATSPVQHVVPGVKYPAVLLTTGANDTRVDPWQAAKMAATLQADSTGGRPILLRVDYQGGHSTSDTPALLADEYSFLLWNMGLPGFEPSLERAKP